MKLNSEGQNQNKMEKLKKNCQKSKIVTYEGKHVFMVYNEYIPFNLTKINYITHLNPNNHAKI